MQTVLKRQPPLQNLMERAVVLGHGANQEETSPALASLVNQYASILAAQVNPLSSTQAFILTCLWTQWAQHTRHAPFALMQGGAGGSPASDWRL